MSTNDPQKVAETGDGEGNASDRVSHVSERSSNQLTVAAPPRRSETDGERGEEKRGPLSGDEFAELLRRIDAIGLTWAADTPPSLRPKDPDNGKLLASEELAKIIEDYPYFPYEVGATLFHVLVGSKEIADNEDSEKKRAAVSEYVITPEFRHEFFFTGSLKVPYFVDADWDVSVKIFEGNVSSFPLLPYALISLDIQQSSYNEEEIKSVFFAVDEKRIHSLIGVLKEALAKLETARGISEQLKVKSTETGVKEDA